MEVVFVERALAKLKELLLGSQYSSCTKC